MRISPLIQDEFDAVEVAPKRYIAASVWRFLPKNHAMKIEKIYKTIIGSANNIIFGISPVGDTNAATIKMMIKAIFQLLIRNFGETKPMRARTYVTAGIWKIIPIANIISVIRSK